MRIGLIDSGEGGLAVAKELEAISDELILIMDKAFFPYGNKTKEFLLKRAYYLALLLVEQKVDVIIIACNTLSIVALEFLQNSFSIPIKGIFSYLIPYLNKDNLFIGSLITSKYVSDTYGIKVIDGTSLIKAIEKKEEIKEQLGLINYGNAKKLVLGCTHFLAIPKASFKIDIINQIDKLKEDLISFPLLVE